MGRDAVAILRGLIAHPSIAGSDNRALMAEIAGHLDDAGAAVTVAAGTRPGSEVLHAVLGPRDAPGGVLLAAHGDVVGTDGQPWTGDPFTLREGSGRLYGRGATDMKGFIAAVLAVAARARPAALRAPLHVAISHDEELGCAGTGPLLDLLGDAAAVPAPPAGVIVGEPTGLEVVSRHKGKAAFAVTVHGRAAHSATPAAGVNAVRGMAHVIVALEQLQATLGAEASDPAFATAHATIGVGPIQGGVAVNIVPDRCTLQVETRVLPGQDLDAVAARIARTAVDAAPAARVEVRRVAGYPALAPAADGAGAAFADRVAHLARRGNGGAVDFGTEAGLYQQRLGIPVVVCGPGSMAQGHTADEFLAVAELTAAEAMLTALVSELSAPAQSPGSVQA